MQILKQIYYGFSLAMLGLTGSECMWFMFSASRVSMFIFWIGTPAYVPRIKDGQFPRVLRNLHFPVIVLNSIIMLLVLAIVPLDVILSGTNVLSALSQMVSQILPSLFFFC